MFGNVKEMHTHVLISLSVSSCDHVLGFVLHSLVPRRLEAHLWSLRDLVSDCRSRPMQLTMALAACRMEPRLGSCHFHTTGWVLLNFDLGIELRREHTD